MKKMLAIILMMLMALTLVACGSETMDATEPTDITEVVTEPTTEAVTEPTTEAATDPAVEYTPRDPEYYYEKGYSWTMSEFWAQSSAVHSDTYIALDAFYEDHHVTEEFIAKMLELNEEYDALRDIYYSVRWGEKTDVSVEEFLSMASQLDGYTPEPMIDIDYDDTWDDAVAYGEYDPVTGWEHNYCSRYADGLYELDDGYHLFVMWSQNIENANGADPDEAVYRAYKVIDSNEPAYLLLWGVETGWQLVRINPVTIQP